MFRKFFFMLGMVSNNDLDFKIKKVVHDRNDFVKMPKDIKEWDKSYREMVRELSKR